MNKCKLCGKETDKDMFCSLHCASGYCKKGYYGKDKK